MDAIVNKILAFYASEGESGGDFHATNVVVENTSRLAVAIIVFSKERPYQLHQLLRSITLHVKPWPATVRVIYIPGDYELEYRSVFGYSYQSFSRIYCPHLEVEAIRQSDDFHGDLKRCIQECAQFATHILFAVDDLIFIDDVDILLAAKTLMTRINLFTVHLKLHPGIIYSHAASKYCPPPVLKPVDEEDDTYSFCQFDLSAGKVDWRYPFDLCASLYRVQDMLRLIDCFEEQRLGAANQNPNNFETLGNQVFWRLSSRQWATYKGCLCSVRPLLRVVTINQVQSTFKVPIFHNPQLYEDQSIGGRIQVDDIEQHGFNLSDISVLNRTLLTITNTVVDQSKNFDLERYRYLLSSTVHVGDVLLAPRAKDIMETRVEVEQRAKVTLLLPIYNGAKFIDKCLQRILFLVQSTSQIPFHLIIIDDGSIDGTIDRINNFIAIFDTLRPNGTEVLLIRHSENLGLSKSLDEGVSIATTEYVARIDVDDEILPQRLQRQLSFLDSAMSRAQGIHVVGSQAVLIKHYFDPNRNDYGNQYGSCEKFVSNMPCHPYLVQCQMYLNCAILHPTVCFRKVIVVECGGYCGSYIVDGENYATNTNTVESKYMEDYSLWLRILQRYPFAIANLPDVETVIHQHHHSKTYVEAAHAREVRFQLLGTAWQRLFLRSDRKLITSTEKLQQGLKVIVYPLDYLKDVHDRQNALELLDNLELCLLQLMADKPMSEESKDIIFRCVKAKVEQHRKQINSVAKTLLAEFAFSDSRNRNYPSPPVAELRPEMEDIMHRLANMI